MFNKKGLLILALCFLISLSFVSAFENVEEVVKIVTCEDGACLNDSVNLECNSDTDGEDPDIFGITGYSQDYFFGDYCIDESVLREFYCAGGEIRSTLYECNERTCENGVCLYPGNYEPLECDGESDNGEDPENSGYVAYNQDYIYSDECNTSRILVETYCEHEQIDEVYYLCELGVQEVEVVEEETEEDTITIFCHDNFDNDGDGAIDNYGGCDWDLDGTLDATCENTDIVSCYEQCTSQMVQGAFYPPDAGCEANANTSEYNRCGDGYDNDMDGRIDYTGGCSLDDDLTIDYYCGCDGNADGYINIEEMRVSKEGCTTRWGCNKAGFGGPILIEFSNYQCEDGTIYYPDLDCVALGDDTERDNWFYSYSGEGYSVAEYVEEIDYYAAPSIDEEKGFLTKLWNFFFGI